MARARTMKGAVQSAQTEGERAAKKAAYSPLMDKLARLGYGVKGLIYILIGLLAVQGALGKSATPADQIGAIVQISKLRYGEIALALVLVGLVSYSLWGLIRAILDPYHKGNDTAGLLARGGYLVSAITYASFVFPTYELLTGKGSGSNQTSKFVASLMSMPFGRLIVGLIGLGVLAGGIYQVYLGITANFDKQFKAYALNADQRRIAIESGRIGTVARGIVFAIAGFFLTIAAYYARPSQAQGLRGAFTFLAQQPYGLWLLGIIATGLVVFGIYSLMCAAWFRFKDTQS